jgi:hypothetical protein
MGRAFGIDRRPSTPRHSASQSASVLGVHPRRSKPSSMSMPAADIDFAERDPPRTREIRFGQTFASVDPMPLLFAREGPKSEAGAAGAKGGERDLCPASNAAYPQVPR